MAPNKSLSTLEVANLLHVSKSTIYELIRRGEINSYKIGRKVRFTQDDVDAYIARSRHERSMQPVRRSEISSSLLNPKQPDAGRVRSGQAGCYHPQPGRRLQRADFAGRPAAAYEAGRKGDQGL